ncbi:hypothetical protein Mcup_0701 [Metallosphaera cuprina Ar-4]|uniref:Uncharacterized protein n=1 Tax=Metallosphaera cuprina (strain Ar-4) TaxID=1006006 RepID=F4G1J3_METCR|nr:hypothetical protein Mcup_0701 [Metallosphaera cuprina Ar-4]
MRNENESNEGYTPQEYDGSHINGAQIGHGTMGSKLSI